MKVATCFDWRSHYQANYRTVFEVTSSESAHFLGYQNAYNSDRTWIQLRLLINPIHTMIFVGLYFAHHCPCTSTYPLISTTEYCAICWVLHLIQVLLPIEEIRRLIVQRILLTERILHIRKLCTNINQKSAFNNNIIRHFMTLGSAWDMHCNIKWCYL